jgi:aspartate kinase
MHPDHPGTVIEPSRAKNGVEVTSVASKRGIHLVNIVSARMLGQSGFMATVFDAFKRHDVVVDLVATSEVSVTASVDRPDGLDEVVAELREVATVTVEKDNALVAVVGERMRNASGLAGRVFAAVGEAGVPIRAISYGATKTNLQIVVPVARMEDTVRALHRALFD